MIKTDNCCCCFGLRTGCLIIGWIQVIFPLLNIIGAITIKTNDGKSEYQITTGNFWGDSFCSIIQLIAAILLLYGVYKSQRSFVTYYIYLAVLVIVIRVALVIITFVASNQADPLAVIISILITTVFFLYLLVVVYSYREQM